MQIRQRVAVLAALAAVLYLAVGLTGRSDRQVELYSTENRFGSLASLPTKQDIEGGQTVDSVLGSLLSSKTSLKREVREAAGPVAAIREEEGSGDALRNQMGGIGSLPSSDFGGSLAAASLASSVSARQNLMGSLSVSARGTAHDVGGMLTDTGMQDSANVKGSLLGVHEGNVQWEHENLGGSLSSLSGASEVGNVRGWLRDLMSKSGDKENTGGPLSSFEGGSNEGRNMNGALSATPKALADEENTMGSLWQFTGNAEEGNMLGALHRAEAGESAAMHSENQIGSLSIVDKAHPTDEINRSGVLSSLGDQRNENKVGPLSAIDDEKDVTNKKGELMSLGGDTHNMAGALEAVQDRDSSNAGGLRSDYVSGSAATKQLKSYFSSLHGGNGDEGSSGRASLKDMNRYFDSLSAHTHEPETHEDLVRLVGQKKDTHAASSSEEWDANLDSMRAAVHLFQAEGDAALENALVASQSGQASPAKVAMEKEAIADALRKEGILEKDIETAEKKRAALLAHGASKQMSGKKGVSAGVLDPSTLPTGDHDNFIDHNPNSPTWTHDNYLDKNPHKVGTAVGGVHGQMKVHAGRKGVSAGLGDITEYQGPSGHYDKHIDHNPDSTGWQRDPYTDLNPPRYDARKSGSSMGGGLKSAVGVHGVMKQPAGRKGVSAGPLDMDTLPQGDHDDYIDHNPKSPAWDRDNYLDKNPYYKLGAVKGRGAGMNTKSAVGVHGVMKQPAGRKGVSAGPLDMDTLPQGDHDDYIDHNPKSPAWDRDNYLDKNPYYKLGAVRGRGAGMNAKSAVGVHGVMKQPAGRKGVSAGPLDMDTLPQGDHDDYIDHNPKSPAWDRDNYLDKNPYYKLGAVKGRGAGMNTKSAVGVHGVMKQPAGRKGVSAGPLDMDTLPQGDHDDYIDHNPKSPAWDRDNYLDKNPYYKLGAVKGRGLEAQHDMQARLEGQAQRVAQTVKKIKQSMRKQEGHPDGVDKVLSRTEAVMQSALKHDEARLDAAARKQSGAQRARHAEGHSTAGGLAHGTGTAWGWLNRKFFEGEKGVRQAEREEAAKKQALSASQGYPSTPGQPGGPATPGTPGTLPGAAGVRGTSLTGRVGEVVGLGMCSLLGVACS